MNKTLLFFLSTIAMQLTAGQAVLPLYDVIPNAKPVPNQEYADTSEGILIVHKVSVPTLTIFPAPKKIATGTAVIIVPGGGYWIVAAGHEGYDAAREFNKMGVTAFVLKYRIPDDSTMVNREIGPLQDAQRAIQIVREQARHYGIYPDRVGILGFSAGGHLASTAGTHFNKVVISNPKKTSLRPDFMILIYPVISFTDSIGHIGSRNQLIGQNPPQQKITEYSNELQVNAQTPPTYLVHARDDSEVKVANTLEFEKALERNGVPHGTYLFEHGGHGFGLKNSTSNVQWMNEVQRWMKKMGWVK